MGLFFKKKPRRISAPSQVEERLLLEKYPVEIHRTPRRRQTSLMVQPRGQILIKCALNTSQRDLEKIVLTNEDWLKGHLKRAVEYQQKYPLKKFISGETFPVQGELFKLQINLGMSRRWKIELHQDQLRAEVPQSFKELYTSPEQLRNAGLEEIRAFYKKFGVEVLAERMRYWSERSGLQPTKISYRSQKTLWGSCSSQGRISLNWRMVAFPKEVYDYILVHELCHLVHQNHSPSFWHLVGNLIPNYRERRLWLRQNQNSVDFLSK